MAEEQAAGQGEFVKRRRRSKSRKGGGTWADWARGNDFGRLVFFGMCLLGLAYVGKIVYDTRLASLYYNMVVVEFPESEVRYVLGTPDSIEEGGRLYRYVNSDRAIATRFSERGLMTSVTCTAEQRDAEGCEDTLDVGIGKEEDEILLALGAPSRISYSGNDKIMHYDGLGLHFIMRRYKVHGIQLHDGGSFIGYLPRALWRMLP